MGVIKVPTSFNIELDFEVPGFGRRMLSLIIDFIVEFIYLRIVFEILTSMYKYGTLSDGMTAQAISMLLLLPILVYHFALEMSMNGQSIGKKIMKIKVVHENGGRPSVSQYLIRWLLRISDLWIIFIFVLLATFANGSQKDIETVFIVVAALGFLLTDIFLVAGSKKGQRIGDILAKTIIIRTASKVSIEETIFREMSDTYVPKFPVIMQLTDKDINAIKNILEIHAKNNDITTPNIAAAKIKNHLHIESSMDPVDFLETLLNDYNYLSVK